MAKENEEAEAEGAIRRIEFSSVCIDLDFFAELLGGVPRLGEGCI